MGRHRDKDRPMHAWLAPIVGYGIAIVLAVMLGRMFSETDNTRFYRLIRGAIPFAALLACHVFGYIKSIQCLRGRRSVVNGIAGLIVNTLSLAFIISMIVFLVQFDGSGPQALAPQDAIAAICSEFEGKLPSQVDESTTLVGVYQGPPTTINLQFHVHGIPRESFTKEVLDRLEQTIREEVTSKHLYPELEGRGATVRYVYYHENGDLLREFTIKS